MLVRIRRLAGSVLGGGFILLLALSMLQMGDGSNPLSFFRATPTVVTVGNATANWDELGVMSGTVDQLFPFVPDVYEDLPYGAVLAVLAAEDAWDGGALSLSSAGQQQLATLVGHRGNNSAALGLLEQRVAPVSAFYAALSGQISDRALTLPPTLRAAPRKQVTQAFDFDLLTVPVDLSQIETPEDSVLEAHLAANPERFERPATWDIEGVVLSVEALAQTLEVSDDQLRIYYNNNTEDFNIAEGHEVITLTFATPLEATLFTAQIDAQTQDGLPIEEAIAEAIATSTAQQSGAGLRPTETLSEEEAAYISSAEPGSLSPPREGEDGSTSFLYYAQSVAAQTRTFAEARDQVEAAFRLANARAIFADTVDRLHAAYIQGTLDLEGVAAQGGAQVQRFAGLQTLETAPAALQSEAVFQNLNAQRQASTTVTRSVLTRGARELLSRVTAYEPPRPFTLQEARDQVLRSWQLEEASARARATAREAQQRLEDGAPLSDVVAALSDDSAGTLATDALNAETLANLSRLRLASEEGLNGGFIAQWDAAAAARFTGNVATFTQQSILALNQRVTSPFAMADGEVRTLDQGSTLIVVRATRLAPEAGPVTSGATETDLSPEDREALIDSLTGYEAGGMHRIVRFAAALSDVAEGRDFQVDEDAISEQQSIAQQRQNVQQANASHGGL